MLAKTLEYMFPGIDFMSDCILQDDGDGPYIKAWRRAEKQPTQAEIEAAAPAAAAAAARAAIRPVTRRQMLTALHRVGLLATIKAAVAASGDVELQIAFDESQEFQRNNPFLASMAAALGKTDAEIDAVFALAATL
jgi:hypothetical protein